MDYLCSATKAAFLGLVFLAATSSFLRGASLVIVKAQASEEFTLARADDPAKKVMTYTFMKGRFHPGQQKDPGMDDMAFNELALELAKQLQRQDFLPTPDPKKADLLIVVHYGVTSIQDSWEELQGYTSMKDYGFGEGAIASSGARGGSAQVDTFNAIQDMQFQVNSELAVGEANEGFGNYTARLIGMEKAFSDEIGPSEEGFLKHLLSEERYFVVLIAYDLPKLRQGEIVPQWTTRYSIRAVGQAYGDALKDMNIVAGNYFGRNLGDIVQKRVTDKTRVQLGELEVIEAEPVDEEAASPER